MDAIKRLRWFLLALLCLLCLFFWMRSKGAERQRLPEQTAEKWAPDALPKSAAGASSRQWNARLEEQASTSAFAAPSEILDCENLAQSGDGNLFGTVVYAADAQPAARAEVWLSQIEQMGFVKYRQFCDDQGRFAFKLEFEGPFHLSARVGNFVSRPIGPMEREVLEERWKERRRAGPIRLQLVKSAELLFQVFAEGDHRPLSQVQVVPKTQFTSAAITDAAGIASLQLPPGLWQILSLKPGFELERKRILVREGENQPISLYLRPGGALWGNVRTSSDEVPAQIRIYTNNNAGEFGLFYANGAYRLEGLPLGKIIYLYAASGDSFKCESSVKLTEAAPRQRLDLLLKSTRTERAKNQNALFRVQLLDKQNQPVANFPLEMKDEQEKTQTHYTDARGKLELTGLPEGERFYLQSHQSEFALFEANAIDQIDVAPAAACVVANKATQASTYLLYLMPNLWIEGKLLLPNGEPAVGALYSNDLKKIQRYDAGIWDESIYTDSEGHFRLDKLSPKDQIYFYLDGYSIFSKGKLEFGRKDYLFKLQPLGRIRGEVRDAVTGKPLERFQISFDFEDGIFFDHNQASQDLEIHDSKGQFELLDLDLGAELTLQIHAEQHKPKKINGLRPKLAPKDQPHLWSLEPDDGQVAGTLFGSNGRRLANQEVYLLLPNADRSSSGFWDFLYGKEQASEGTLYQTRSDARGQFSIMAPVTGAIWWLGVKGSGIAMQSFTTLYRLPESQWRTLQLECKAESRVKVRLDPDSEAKYSVYLLLDSTGDNNNFTRGAQLSAHQPQTFDQLLAGSYRLEAVFAEEGSENMPKEQRFDLELREGEEQEVLLKNPERYRLSGRIFFGQELLKNASVGLWNRDWFRTTTDDRGRFSFKDLSAGAYKIYASSTDFNSAELFHLPESSYQLVELRADLERDFTFKPGGRVFGKLEPAGFYTCSLNKGDSQIAQRMTSVFNFEHVPAGRYSLSVQIQETELTLLQEIELQDDETLDLGVLKLGNASLRLVPVGPIPRSSADVSLALQREGQWISKDVKNFAQEMKLTKLTPGRYQLTLKSMGPFYLQPSRLELEILGDQEQAIQLTPITLLEVYGKPEEPFAALKLQTLPSGPIYNFQLAKLAPLELGEQAAPTFVFFNNRARALGLPEGSYQLQLFFESGEQETRLIELKAGEWTSINLQ